MNGKDKISINTPNKIEAFKQRKESSKNTLEFYSPKTNNIPQNRFEGMKNSYYSIDKRYTVKNITGVKKSK